MWKPCACGEFWCTAHRTHAFECECPPIEEWTTDPYGSKKGGRGSAKTGRRFFLRRSHDNPGEFKGGGGVDG